MVYYAMAMGNDQQGLNLLPASVCVAVCMQCH